MSKTSMWTTDLPPPSHFSPRHPVALVLPLENLLEPCGFIPETSGKTQTPVIKPAPNNSCQHLTQRP